MKKLKKKTISLFLFIALMVGMGLSSYSAAADNVRDSPEEFLGHKFDEEYWAIVYDVLDRETVQDFTPGPYSDEYQEPNFDFFPNLQAEFYSVYVDIGAVETVFMSLMNYSRD